MAKGAVFVTARPLVHIGQGNRYQGPTAVVLPFFILLGKVVAVSVHRVFGRLMPAADCSMD